MNDLQIFKYQDKQIRTVERNGEPWWVLKDVCEVLEINNHKMTAQRLDVDEVSQTDLTAKHHHRQRSGPIQCDSPV